MDNRVTSWPPNQRTAILTNQWDSLETDPEILAQERVCKQQLRMHIGDHILPQGKLNDSLKEGNWEVAVGNNIPHEDEVVSDRIEVAPHSHRTGEPGRDAIKSKPDACDACSELCCYPNWNPSEKGTVITESLKCPVSEYHHFFHQSQKPFIRGYRYIADTRSMIPISGSDCNQPYHLHPQDGQVSPITTQCYHSNGLLQSSPKSNSSHSCRDRNTRQQTKDQPKIGCPNVDANIERSLEMSEHTEAVHTMNLKEYQTCNRKDLQHISPRSFPTSPTIESSQIRLKKKRHTHTEDLVERNKKTLGRSTSGNGSYADVHALQQKNPCIGKKHGTAQKVATGECPKESSDPEQSLSQQLKVTHIIEGSKEQSNMERYFRSMEKSPELERTAALKCYLSIKESEKKRCLENVPTIPLCASENTGVYTKLPPIMPKQCFRQCVKTINPNNRSSSADFLTQMEDKKRTRTNYKTYSLKEYKELKLDVKLQGLGPDYTAVKKQAEKMIQQKLYSNAVRERNKNMTKIPFLLAKDPVGKDRKVPRIKALEYAKTIVKPLSQPPQSKSSKTQQLGDSIGRTPCTESWNISQQATVDLLMKRHQEEKEALSRKVHVI
ncbi:jhy protein homolog isoform X2 [Hippocampus comes]|uniref:jhy protein homolog isoform X2 n=1 Tax=Hippocampus comes TaxID=109280 RepID=UPI00094E67A0|nr:PREDICTED: uncharacterized protein C11orf63 homolog isoform X2 [Hippocampus comes]